MLSWSTSGHLPWTWLTWLGHWLTLTGQAVGVLKNLSRLSRRRCTPLLLRRLLWLLALQNGGLLRRWRLRRLTGKFGVELLLLLRRALPLLELLLRWLLVLLLLRALQDLRRMLAREAGWHTRWHTLHPLHAGHTGEGRLALIELLLVLLVLLVLLRVAHARRGLDWGRRPSLIGKTLTAHHSLNLIQSHSLLCATSMLGGAAGVLHRRRLVLRLLLALSCRLLWLQAPDVGTRLQLRDVVRVLVAFIAGPGRLRGL
jgi:hypothetical protein